MASGKTHDFHIVNPSWWPLLGAFSAMVMLGSSTFWWHGFAWGKWTAAVGLLGVLATFFFWFSDVRDEANQGDHTPVVQLHHRYGMILFIASEVMFFVAWFWAFFAAALFPSTAEAVGGQWPPVGIEPLDPFVYPLLNTLILLLSGTTVTWAHHALIHGDRKGFKQGLWVTVVLGLLFSALQAYEYSHATFGFAGNIYGATFYMATGFHGFHVIIGTIFLAVCLWRAYLGDFTPKQHFGFEAAAWYWHFVDVVWLFLFLAIYIWGSNFGAAVVAHAG
jgi:cytochrome c oxidase subunit 3